MKALLRRRCWRTVVLWMATVVLAGCADVGLDEAGQVAVDPPLLGADAPHSSGESDDARADGSAGTNTATLSSTSLPPATTTTYPTTTTSTVPSVSFEGRTYECAEGYVGEWTCESGLQVIYCSGLSEPNRCSPLWYPDELDDLRLVEFRGLGYACEQFGTACVRYDGGPPPTYIVQADIWCDSTSCFEYDPEQYFEVVFQAQTYLCESAILGFQEYDCYQWYGGAPAVVTFRPDLYCSGSEYFPECSTLWYPSELAPYTLFDGSDGTYLCESAFTGRSGDYDCGLYTGGDPSLVYFKPLKCSSSYGGIECDRDDYPSFLAEVFFTTIDWSQHACRSSWGGSECWRYSFGSVEAAMFGLPDYYCNHSGYCDPYGYR